MTTAKPFDRSMHYSRQHGIVRPRDIEAIGIPREYLLRLYRKGELCRARRSRVKAKIEHPFRILKRVFGFTKVRYRGIWKNHQWLCGAFALVNLYQHRNRLAPQRA